MLRLLTYAAPCVRARAMRSSLLLAADWERLLQLRGTGQVLSWLAQRGLVSSSTQDVSEA